METALTRGEDVWGFVERVRIMKLYYCLTLLRDHISSVQVSYLIVFFKDAQFIPVKRSELFGLTDFLANCGGLLGLFMGVSILSLVEIFYYCFIKPLVMWCKASKPEGENQVQVKTVSSLAEPISIWRYEGQM